MWHSKVSFDCLLYGQHFCKKISKSVNMCKSQSKPKWDFFETRCSSSDKQSQKSSSSFSRTVPRHTGRLRQSTFPHNFAKCSACCYTTLWCIANHNTCFRFFCSSDINISQGIVANSDAFEVWWSILLLHCSKFIAQPVGERILKICQILAKWKANI